MLAAMVDVPRQVTEAQMDAWIRDFDSWDLCDNCCMGLFDKTPFAYAKAMQWSTREREFEKRAGFAMMAALAVHDKKADNDKFDRFLRAIVAGSSDSRNFVRKAVNWALRQIGKRNEALRQRAMATAEEILATGHKSGRWVANDALRELRERRFPDAS